MMPVATRAADIEFVERTPETTPMNEELLTTVENLLGALRHHGVGGAAASSGAAAPTLG